MYMHSNQSGPGARVPEGTFTGEVRINDYTKWPTPSRLVGAVITFHPGSRTPWKVNPMGQTIVVTAGEGLAQTDDNNPITLRPGDVIWFAPGQRHWEGATPEHSLTYVALQEETNESVRFKEAVSEKQYLTSAAVISRL